MAGNEALSPLEKAQVALGAAIGAGCRTCAEVLTPTLRSLGASDADLRQLAADALALRGGATEVMRQKTDVLLGRLPGADAALRSAAGTRVEELVRTGTAVAANCAPHALAHMERARAAGASEAQIGVAIGIGRTVRAKAQHFSDEEIGKSSAVEAPADGAPESCGPMSSACAPTGDGICC